MFVYFSDFTFCTFLTRRASFLITLSEYYMRGHDQLAFHGHARTTNDVIISCVQNYFLHSFYVSGETFIVISSLGSFSI